MKPYNVGIYVRLSVEDSAKSKKYNPFQSESVSIENQRTILHKYAELNGWSVHKVYSDDGFSGGNFRRPGFEEMLADAKSGAINLILVKDLSRFGRAYVDVGYYTEEVFLSLGVRFIALMDDIDSENNADILPFRSILNDFYLKDLSKKIKAVIRAKAKAGEYGSSQAPYGYSKNAENPSKFIVDSYAAGIVKRIFELRLNKNGYGKIVQILNNEGIVNPKTYYYQSINKPKPRNYADEWTILTVKGILKNEIYIGNSVRMKSGTVSYKNKAMAKKSEDEWIRAENTHEAIIDRIVWDAVQRVNMELGGLVSKRKSPEMSLFSGLLFCGDCGRYLAARSATNQRVKGIVACRSYQCSYNRNTGGTKCSRHSISEKVLLRLVREDIRNHLENLDEQKMISEIQNSFKENEFGEVQNRLKKIPMRLAELENYTAKLYKNRLNGTVSLDVFKRLSSEAETEQTEIQSEYDRLTAAVEESEKRAADTSRLIETMRKYLDLETIDRETLVELIERIEVGEREGKDTGKNRRQEVRIIYK